MMCAQRDPAPITITVPDDMPVDVPIDRAMLASLATHELREPVQAVRSFLAVVLDRRTGPLTELQEEFLSAANHSARRVGRLIDDLQIILTTGEAPEVRKRRIDLATRVSACCRELSQIAADAGVILHSEHQSQEPQMVHGDPDRIDQIVLNLLENAIQYAPAGSTVVVGTPALDQHECGVFIENVVADTTRATLDEWFLPFNRGGRIGGGGLGLGLTVVQLLVQAHDGQLGVTLDANRVRATVSFPRDIQGG